MNFARVQIVSEVIFYLVSLSRSWIYFEGRTFNALPLAYDKVTWCTNSDFLSCFWSVIVWVAWLDTGQLNHITLYVV